MRLIKKSIVTGLLAVAALAVSAQQVNTLYFMNNVQERGNYNPAFQSVHGFWIDIPVMPNFRMNFGNNSFAMEDVLIHKTINGKDSLITPLHPAADRDAFYDELKNNTKLDFGFTFNILNFGFKVKQKNYFTFGINERLSMTGSIPKDFFSLLLYGTPTEGSRTFDFSDLGLDVTAYTEFSAGYSRVVNDRLTLGGKVKYLIGQANLSTKVNKLKLTGGADQWTVEGDGDLRVSAPKLDIPIDENGDIVYKDIDMQKLAFGDVFTSNWGLGLDLGATYTILKNLQLSAAVTDLGFIRWSENATQAHANGGYTFDGIHYNLYDNMGDKVDTIRNNFENAFGKSGDYESYTTMLSTRLNVGAEYALWKNRIGFGLLSSTLFAPKMINTSWTASANFRPKTWFSTTVSYSIADGMYDNLGVGLQFRLAPWNMYIAMDRIPLHLAKKSYVPYDTKHVNLQVGMVFELGWKIKKKDDDRDGVKNKRDKCPNTPLGYLVDKNGCTVDADGDGVADNVDQCPTTPAGDMVDSLGCTVDSDGDGVADNKDKCANTPSGVKVDANGCPIDSDGDGVADYLDKCPNTPKAAIGKVDATGCPLDSDGDGVADYMDQCPDTPKEAIGKVDSVGCALDSDGDGVADYLDKCPEVAGSVERNGCPEPPKVTAAAKKAFQRAMKGIQFQTGKDVILAKSNASLNDVAKVLQENPEYVIEINGYTDNVGNKEANLKLSQARAAAVKKYLEKKGIASERMTSQGFGDENPIDTNKTAKGRANNRRVEFVVKGVE